MKHGGLLQLLRIQSCLALTRTDSYKDTREKLNLFYDVGEIIHIGVNQATYTAAKNKLKSDDYMPLKSENELEQDKTQKSGKITSTQAESIIRYVKGHIRNRGLLMYPDNPVYVNRAKSRIHGDILRDKVQKGNEVCNCSKPYTEMIPKMKITQNLSTMLDVPDAIRSKVFVRQKI